MEGNINHSTSLANKNENENRKAFPISYLTCQISYTIYWNFIVLHILCWDRMRRMTFHSIIFQGVNIGSPKLITKIILATI